jgi:hypothetical protein
MSDAHEHERAGGAEILQGAALEAIKAFRAFLDIAETVVREPGMAATVGKAFADAATSAFRPHQAANETEQEGSEADDEPGPRVRRINLTD